MKFFLVTLFVAAVAAAPVDDAVEVIVNGVPEGHALELGNLVDIKLKEHVEGQVAAATDLLRPYTAEGIVEAALAQEVVPSEIDFVDAPVSDDDKPSMIVQPLPPPMLLPAPSDPIVQPLPPPALMPAPSDPIVQPLPPPMLLPGPTDPIVQPLPPPMLLPGPTDPIVQPLPPPMLLPAPSEPIVQPEPEPLPAPAPQGPNEIYNDGIVQVQVNGEDPGMFSTLRSWFNMVVNYFNDDVPVSHHIV